MKSAEPNWTLLPFCAFGLLFSLSLCLLLRPPMPAALGWFLLLFLAGVLAGALLYALALCVISLFIDMKQPQERYAPFYNANVTFVMGLVPAFFRVRIHAEGTGRIPEGRWLLVSNHRSGFDPLVTGWVLRRTRLAFITKPAIQQLPVVGPFIHKACFLGIDRENDRAALKTILQAIRLVKEGIISIGIYPEGTRNTGGGLLPFRNGAFKIAQKAKSPIVVTAVRGTEQILKNFPWRPTDVYVQFLSVMDAETVSGITTAEIGEQARKLILSSTEAKI